MHSRRLFLRGGAAAAATVLFPIGAVADHRIAGTSPMGPIEVAEYPLNQIGGVYAAQRCMMWCWAATLEMLFRANGFEVPQEQIVDETFGARICTTASPSVIIANTNRIWRDAAGSRFRARTRAAYDFFNGIYALNNNTIIEALSDNRPMIYCNRSHMMLLTAIQYVQTPNGPNVSAVGFFDPWPAPTPGTQSPMKGARGAKTSEMVAANLGGEMTYVAEVEIEPI